MNRCWHCEICDYIMIEELKNKHLESKFHFSYIHSTIRRYIISNPLLNKIEDTIRKSLRIHYGEYNQFRITLLLKLLMPSNQTKYIRIQRSSRRYRLCLPNAIFFPKTKNIIEQLYSQILEIIITFDSLSKNITFDHYLTKPKPMLEWKLLEMLDKILKLCILLITNGITIGITKFYSEIFL